MRITGSRVTLDTIIGAFQKGAIAEQIRDSFPSLSLAQIYGAIAYYLEHEAGVETYLLARRAEAESIKHEIESQQDTAGFRASISHAAHTAKLRADVDMKDVKGSQLIGRYIVTNPKICHGKPTFRGTRVLVADVLEQVASGVAWETIIEDWNDSITKEAIGEAVHLASQALLKHANEFVLELKSA